MERKPGIGKSSTCIAQGYFSGPSTVLDAVTNAAKVEDGIIEIESGEVTGRLGVKNSSIVTDAVLDKTGETGTGAVCKLLLLPHGTFKFRQAIPSDHLHFQQDLHLTFDDVKKFLSGASAIGLSSPSRQTLNNLRALTGENELISRDLSWDEPEDSDETKKNKAKERVARRKAEIASQAMVDPGIVARPGSGERLNEDIKKLVETVDRKRTKEIEIKQKERQTHTNLEALKKPGPLPKRKEDRKPLDKTLIFAGVGLLMLVVSLSMLIENLIHPKPQEVATSNPVPTISFEPTVKAPAPSQPAAGGSAPFALPDGAGPPKTPPPLPATPAPKTTRRRKAPVTRNSPDISEVNRWMSAVSQNPADASARKELAHAYLIDGNTNKSIEQFYAVMKLRQVDSEEIIDYANNLMVFGSKDLARQFLTNILRSDRSRNAIRERLAELH